MADLIPRDAAVRALASSNGDYFDAWERIEKIPAVDAVPVVRCKDCVCGLGPNENGWYMCDNTGGGYPANGYCSDGERRNDDGED